MTLHEYLQGMKGKTAAVIGLGVSNRPLVELLARNGVKVIACDRKERAALGGAAAHYEALGAVLHLGEGYLRDLDADVVFRTPGMRPDVPELLEAKAHGAVITSEMEAFFAVCPCPILGVTGSDGKTTTASVIAELLKAEGRRVRARRRDLAARCGRGARGPAAGGHPPSRLAQCGKLYGVAPCRGRTCAR